jgi:hypothetical protein
MEASAEPREASARRGKAVALPVSAGVYGPAGGMRTHGCWGLSTPWRTTLVRATA